MPLRIGGSRHTCLLRREAQLFERGGLSPLASARLSRRLLQGAAKGGMHRGGFAAALAGGIRHTR